MPDQNEIIIGSAAVEYGGVPMGYTTEDGVKLSGEYTNTEFTPSQSIGTPAVHRSRVRWTATASFHQLTLAKIKLLQGLANDPTGTSPIVLDGIVSAEPDVQALIITAPGPNKSTRVYMANAIVTTPGDISYSNNEYAAMECEFLLLSDAATDRAWTLYEYPINTTVPSVDSYAKVDPVTGTASTIVDGATGVAVDSQIQATWTTGIRADQLGSERFYLRNTTTGLLVPAAVIYGQTAGNYDYVKVKVIPQAVLAAATEYELVIAPFVRSFIGAQSVQPFGLVFTTA
jgi:hypothetical protein